MMIVAAIGGNAVMERAGEATVKHQVDNIQRAVGALVQLIDMGHQLVITHGNGPQVGRLAQQAAACREESNSPLDVLVAQTQGEIGYQMELALQNALGSRAKVATLLTQVEVSNNDLAFKSPTKPIGPFYDEAEADRIAAENAWTFRSEDGKSRRVVASPLPMKILERDVIRTLIDNGVIVICAGGGGIPVERGPSGELTGVEAVIDKDWTSALLGEDLAAGFLLILTDVDAVYEQWGTSQSRAIRRATPAEMRSRSYSEGSMGPKVAAACHFVDASGGRAGIGKLEDAARILEGRAGTLISPHG